ncbi:MAG: hypothetical protein ACO1OB_30860 [Archangium sp.]
MTRKSKNVARAPARGWTTTTQSEVESQLREVRRLIRKEIAEAKRLRAKVNFKYAAFSLSDAAPLLGVSRAKLNKLIATGCILTFRVGGVAQVPSSEITYYSRDAARRLAELEARS